MDGFAATRADPVTRHIPVVAMTAYSMSGDRERALGAGCDSYITKPIDTKELPGIIVQYLGAARSRASGAAEGTPDPSGGHG